MTPRCHGGDHYFPQTEGVAEKGTSCLCGLRVLDYRFGPTPSRWLVAAGEDVRLSARDTDEMQAHIDDGHTVSADLMGNVTCSCTHEWAAL